MAWWVVSWHPEASVVQAQTDGGYCFRLLQMKDTQRYAISLEYDGSEFCGWQAQTTGCAVQDALERSLAEIAEHPVRVYGAGRTDTGVHATAQVAHFDSKAKRQPSAWVRGVNTNLPKAASVRWVRQVPASFHARHSAHARRYRYLLLNRAQRPGLYACHMGWHHVTLDVEIMQRACKCLVGSHDFNAFRAATCQSSSSIRNMIMAEVDRIGDIVVFTFEANAYLHHMVRNIVAALAYVGMGRRPVDWIAELLGSRNRRRGAPTFSPRGLYLTRVAYNRNLNLPDQEADIPILRRAI